MAYSKRAFYLSRHWWNPCKSPSNINMLTEGPFVTSCLENNSLIKEGKKKKFQIKRGRWGRGPWEGRRRDLPIPNAPGKASTLRALLPWPAGVFPFAPGLAPGHRLGEWCLFWRDLCRCYFDKTVILFPPFPLPHSLTSPIPAKAFVCLCVCVWGRRMGWRAG